MTAWEVYYVRSHGQWVEIVPYHAAIAVYVFISNKLALYAWNYLDITIIVLARAVYFRFKALYDLGEAELWNGLGNVSKWRRFAKDHEELCRLVQDINLFLSPLIFVSYASNVYFVCLQFNLSLNPSGDKSAISNIYAAWSFLHLVARMFLVSITGARVNEWAHKVIEIFRRCPNEHYVAEVKC
ncbi:unnamed protein product [Allacma fusca]|uniref:Uncharacterized protein n=1 Tax=Allacma fusca TaxID=39272 RepID=A0A8J2JZY7_9HEXA|nr:unnamed protein product [Allacma fusca]